MIPEMDGIALESLLREERSRVDAALEDALAEILPLLPPPFQGPVRHGVLAGGKRIRPILLVAAFRACTGAERRPDRSVPPAVYEIAVALELIHAYSLMHDDLPCMDDAELRRGSPTPHKIYGEAATIVGGAALIPAAGLVAWRASRALGLPEEKRRGALRILTRAAGAGGMVGGQGLDLLGEGKDLSREDLDDLHRRKTGALLTAALVLGGVAAEAPSEMREGLRRYGREVGLAFQIADDVLDATADAETLGKNPSDHGLAKSTYVARLGVAGARAEADARVRRAVRGLREAGIDSPTLEALAGHIVGRER